MGVTFGKIIFDAAVYGDPARGYIEQTIRIKGVVSLSIHY